MHKVMALNMFTLLPKCLISNVPGGIMKLHRFLDSFYFIIIFVSLTILVVSVL